MTHRADANKGSVGSVTLGRSQRNLVAVLAAILFPTFVGLGYLVSEFRDSTERTTRDFAAATARDTVVLSAHDHSVTLFSIAQEAFAHPSRRADLYAQYTALVKYLDSLHSTYHALLGQAPEEVRQSLHEKFEHYWELPLKLAEFSAIVFKLEGQVSTRPRRTAVPLARPKGRSGAGQEETYLPDANEFFRSTRVRLDEVLRAELAEDMIQTRNSRSYVEQITYRGFIIAFFLLGVGVTLAVVLTRRGRQFEERTRRYVTLLEYSMNPIQVVDNSGKTRYVNPAFERWVGAPMGEIVGRPAFDRVRPLLQSITEGSFWALVYETVSRGQAWSGEVEVQKQSGEKAYTMLIISPVVNAAGELLECISIHHDVTESRELARKFQESQENYQNIVESSLDGIVIIHDGRLVFVNASAVRIFGYDSADEMKELSFAKTIAPSSRFLSLEEGQRHLIGEDFLRNHEIKGVTKQGKIIDLEVNAKLVAWNGEPGVHASIRDVTERKLLERELALWLWEQETLSTIDRQLVSSVDLQTVLNTICFQAKMLTRSDWSGVMMVDRATNQVRWRAVKGNQVPLREEPFELGKAHLVIIQKREPYVMKDFGLSPELPTEEFPPFGEENIVSAARFPLIVDHEIRGQLVVGYRQHHDFSPREIRLLSSLAEKSSIALANAQLYDNLLARERELELLSGARSRAQEEERRRIAREIHDSLGQMLTAIKFSIEILEDTVDVQDDENRQRIADIKSLLDNAMAEAREISYNLMPSVLVDFGLVPAIQLLCEQFAKRNNLKVYVHTSGVDNRLDPTMEIGLYRIAQEAQNNIAKHAAAQEVNVQLIGTPKNIRLMVEDDGKGFRVHRPDPRAGKRHGMGLVSMRERAASFNGTFALDSSLGRGTEIIVEIPLTDLHDNG